MLLESRQCYRSSDAKRHRNMREALQYIGPLNCLARHVILVTGTTGKSCTCRCLETFANLAGKRVGLFASSYLYSFEEMIRIQSNLLPEEYLCELFAQTFPIVEKLELNHFEWLLFMALWVFKNALLDLVVLEIELGGNHACIELLKADLSIITNIDYDHLVELGETREEIARKKAKILQVAPLAVIAEPDPPIALRARAKELGIKAKWIGEEWSYKLHRHMRLTIKSLYFERLEVAFKKMSIAAISTALVSWELLYGKIPEMVLLNWVNACQLPGRFQVLSGDPIVVIDVASNPKSVRYLFQRLKEFEKNFDLRGWHAICAMDQRALYKESLMPWSLEEETRWYFPKLQSKNALAPERLYELFLKERAMICNSALIALHQARLDACVKSAGVVIFGGEALIRELQIPLRLKWEEPLREWATLEDDEAYPSNLHQRLLI